MILIDSNLVIYAAKPEHDEVRDFLADNDHAVSAVSYVEALGFHGLSADEKRELEQFFAFRHVLPLSDSVLREAVRLRQIRKMSLGDALIAGTALVHGYQLATRNVDDFRWISGLDLLDPLSAN